MSLSDQLIAGGAITTLGGVAAAVYAFRGSRSNNVENTIAKLVEVATTTQEHHVDQLQEDVDRYRRLLLESEDLVSDLREKLRACNHERVNAKSGQKAAMVIIERLELENESLKDHIASLERTIERLRNA